eukprot:gene6897-192_t
MSSFVWKRKQEEGQSAWTPATYGGGPAGDVPKAAAERAGHGQLEPVVHRAMQQTLEAYTSLAALKAMLPALPGSDLDPCDGNPSARTPILEGHTHVVALEFGLRHAERSRLHASVSVNAAAAGGYAGGSFGCSGKKTALSMVAAQGRLAQVNALVNALGADPNFVPACRPGCCADSPLIAAAKAGHAEVVATLLGFGADVDGPPPYPPRHAPPRLLTGVGGGKGGVVRGGRSGIGLAMPACRSYVSSQFPGPPCRRCPTLAMTALAAATAAGHDHVVTVLLAAGADPNRPGLSPVASGGSGDGCNSGRSSAAALSPLEYADAAWGRTGIAARKSLKQRAQVDRNRDFSVGINIGGGIQTLLVLQNATRGWRIQTHGLQPAAMRSAVHAVLLSNERLAAIAASENLGETRTNPCCCGAVAGGNQGKLIVPPPPLPPELWHHILSFVKRADWPTAKMAKVLREDGGGGGGGGGGRSASKSANYKYEVML